jgi:hypothetical protein
MTRDRDLGNCSSLDIPEFEKKIKADFNKIHRKLKRIEKKYNPNDDNLHFDCLQKADVALFRELLSLSRAGLKKVERYDDFFSSASLYADGMFWYDLFLMISAASRGIMDKEAKSEIPQDLIYDLTDILIQIIKYSAVHPGDITKRNHEALGNTLLAFYSKDLVKFIRKKKNAIDSKAAKDFIIWTLKRVEEVKKEIGGDHG